MEEVKVIFVVKNSVHINKENKELKCLVCRISCYVKGDKGEDTAPFEVEWKDFKQKAFDTEIILTKDVIEKTELGYKINGFSIPWTNQYFIKQLLDLGYIK